MAKLGADATSLASSVSELARGFPLGVVFRVGGTILTVRHSWAYRDQTSHCRKMGNGVTRASETGGAIA